MYVYAAENDEVFAYVARDIVLDAFKGINGCVFAYGQTGTFSSQIPLTPLSPHYAQTMGRILSLSPVLAIYML